MSQNKQKKNGKNEHDNGKLQLILKEEDPSYAQVPCILSNSCKEAFIFAKYGGQKKMFILYSQEDTKKLIRCLQLNGTSTTFVVYGSL
ncbi:unnamed protein product [Rotaria sp. Silwood1]|nr:unnamed protein product [Rotaria sp. Silwood1]CAF3331410.1 unnamed protein product [Rotaria sp. Silwood1]CAF4837397.1 unnamed protein product [Rotaria sp. Silwood1]